jgi:TonB-linked SusC/RagA family outer membrane protein
MTAMQRFLYRAFLFLGLLTMCTTLFAQDRTITGRVLTNDNRPISGVTVTVANRSVTTDDNGNFSIVAKQGDVIRFSSVGYTARTATVGTANTIDIRLTEANNELEDVVVVAMDQRRKPRELGYSTANLKGAEIAETQRENFLNSLQGRVAGLTITPTSGAPGAGSSIVLRGFNSLSLSNEPLFVIDGVIVDNQTVNETSNGGSGLGLATDRPNRNNDYTNRIADVNPNDIESITVLKGPEATALYGSQASSGAIVITTKKAKTKKFALQYDNSFRVQKVARYPKTLNLYDNGNNGFPGAVFSYFGPAYAPNTPIFDNVKAFFQAGRAQTHNIGMDFGIDKSIFRVSGSFFDQRGVIPTSGAKRITARISNTTKIGKFLEVIPSFTYTRNENDKVLRSAGGYLLSLLSWPSDVSILKYETDEGGKLALFNLNSPNSDIDNPFFNVENNRSRDETNRYNTTLGVNLTPLKWLSVNGRFGYERYNTDGYTIYHPQSFVIAAANFGQLENYFRRYNGYNHTITATARQKVGNFNLRLMGGTMWQDYKTEMFAVSGTRLLDSISRGLMYKNGVSFQPKDFFNVINPWDTSSTAPNSRSRLLRNNRGLYNYQLLRQLAYFGEFAINYKELIYLNYTHRFEQASTLPEQNRSYNYPGASLSIIASDLIPGLKGNILSYLKIRTSLAQTARLNDPYSTQSVFVNNFASPFGTAFSYGFFNNNPDLEPEKQSTYEVGTEIKLFKNRLGIDATYYNTLNKDQIVQNFRLSYATGFVLNTQNAGSTRNQGVEISLDGTVINTRKFNWNSRINFNHMWNKVVELPANVSEYYNSDTWAYLNARNGIKLGGSTTTITANTYARNNSGQILINPANGFPVASGIFDVVADRNPDFTMGFLNNFRYGNWRMSMLWDFKKGGDIYNGTEQYLTRIGKSVNTADRFQPRIIQGVLRDGKENTANPTPNNIVVIPAYNDAYYINLPDEEFIEKDVNWARLRDVTISYTFPSAKIRSVKGLKSLGFFVTGNDLILITNYTGMDPAVNMNTSATRGVGAFGFDYGTLPTPVSVNFGVRAGF